jgi:hypothetical protein
MAMTDEEIKSLEDRLKLASAAKERIKRLAEALETLKDSDVVALQFDRKVGSQREAIRYLRDVDLGERSSQIRGFQNVCWVDREPGLIQEFMAAAEEIITRRLADAETEFAQV